MLMTRFWTTSQRAWGWLAALAIALVAVMLAAIALTPAAALVVALALLLVGAAAVAVETRAARRATPAAAGRAYSVEPMALQEVLTPEGRLLPGRVVPLDQPTPHQFVLTAEGYVLADSEGFVVYRLGAQPDRT